VSNGPEHPEPSGEDPYAAPSSPGQTPPDQTPPGQPSPGDQPPAPTYGQPTPYGQPPPYGQPQPPGHSAWGYTAHPGTNGLAIASLIGAFFLPPLGIIFGVIAKSQIKRTGQSGNGLATAGIVISVASIVLSFVWVTAIRSHQ
jgi:hypothetical protein